MKRLLSLILCFALIMCGTVFTVHGADTYEPTTAELEAVIKKVRSKIDVPEDQTEFSWYYRAANYRYHSGWQLGWSTPDNDASTSVNCDSDGNITSYSSYSSKSDESVVYKAVLPENGAQFYLDDITAFIYKIAPYTKGHIKLYGTNMSGNLNYHKYDYDFVRVENDIVVPDNGVNVTFDYVTKQICDVNINFDLSPDFGKAPEVIGEQKAREILGTKQNMILSYRIKNTYDDETGKLLSRKAYLVYTPEAYYLSVDAVTGEVYTERDTWQVNNERPANAASGGDSKFGAMESTAADSDNGGYQLSEKELEQLDVLDSLITKDEAVKSVTQNEFLYIDPTLTALEAHLSKTGSYRYGCYPDNSDEEGYVWNINLSRPYDEDSDGYYPYLYATVDAKTGELISFSATRPDFWYYAKNKLDVPELKLDADAAAQKAEDFLKATVPELFAKTRKGEPNYNNVIAYKNYDAANGIYENPVYGIADFSFVRVNEGVDFTYNYLNASVDMTTGKITEYGKNWFDNVEFESPSDAITPKEAFDVLYNSDGFGLNYEINSTYTYNKYLADEKNGDYIDYDKLYETSLNVRAVYSGYDMGTTIVRALDGKLADYSGEEYKVKAPYEYTDISESWAEDIIERFAYADIGFEGDKFEPDKPITSDEFKDILGSCSIYSYRIKDYTPSDTLTRTEAVKMIINSYGYEKIAALENVFITDFADNMSLKPEDVGSIAIARGFGIVNGDGENFKPYDTLTRAQALQLCLNVLTSELNKR